MTQDYSVTLYRTESHRYVQTGTAIHADYWTASSPILGFVNSAQIDKVRKKARGWRELLRKKGKMGLCLVFGDPHSKPKVTAPIIDIKCEKIGELPEGITEKVLAGFVFIWSAPRVHREEYSNHYDSLTGLL